MKVGVLVVAYNAEGTIASVLDRIPAGFAAEVAEVLVLDDHSSDRTLEATEAYCEARPGLPVTVRRQPKNLGYGGNQKSGYRYAADNGWDVAVMLHGDGQYPPEALGDMVDPIVSGEADAVFGSRMTTLTSAREGGMPLYKLAGNRSLTTIQNRLAGLELTEWHSGYRAYRVSALSELPLETNSDNFDFDTEIILQLHAAGQRITEIPIPTYYGDETCHVNGLAYARDIMVHTLRYRLGSRGFGQGQLGHVGSIYEYKLDGTSSHGRILAMMEGRPPCRVLDVGCGPGWLAGQLRARGHHVVGVDLIEHPDVTSRTDRFVRADLDDGLPPEVGGGFDVILAADVIEHVRAPERLLRDLTDRLREDGILLASVPNISHWYSRGRVALGLFNYDQRGILDRTHLRFFTRRSFLKLARLCRLEPRATRHTGLPFDSVGLGSGGLLGRIARRIDGLLVRLWPTMFAYQFVYELSVRQGTSEMSDPPVPDRTEADTTEEERPGPAGAEVVELPGLRRRRRLDATGATGRTAAPAEVAPTTSTEIRRSLVIPMYHERDRIPATLRRLSGTALDRADTEILLVDDGSHDGTAEVATTEAAARSLQARVLAEPHRGKGAAVASGVLAARGTAVVFTDADLSAGVADILACFEAVERGEADVVAGTRAHPDSEIPTRGSPVRKLSGWGYNRILRGLGLTTMRDTQCGLKGYGGDVARALFGDLRTLGFAFDIEILARAERLGLRVTEIPVTWSHRSGSRIRVGRDSVHMAVDSLRIRHLVNTLPREDLGAPAIVDPEIVDLTDSGALPAVGDLTGR